jgi:hypothetical protein
MPVWTKEALSRISLSLIRFTFRYREDYEDTTVPPPNSTVMDIFSLRTGSTADTLGNAKDQVRQIGIHSPAL